MATPLDNINTAIANVTATIASITANPQPDYSVQGVSLSYSSYLSALTKELGELQESAIYLSGPYQLTTVGVS